jgi:hypothetical protein
MELGFNKANVYDKLHWVLQGEEAKRKPCVFLSHKKEDKHHCRTIANYIRGAGLDYYLDENDTVLQSASATGNSSLITECIKKGIRESTHMLVIVSEKTYKSQWVPFEIGYGHSAILDRNLKDGEQFDKIKLSVLTLKDLSESPLPDYLLVGNLIRGTKGLNEYILHIGHNIQKAENYEFSIESNNKIGHPLDSVLNWKL